MLVDVQYMEIIIFIFQSVVIGYCLRINFIRVII